MSTLVSLVAAGMGLYLLLWAVRTGRSVAGPAPPAAAQGMEGDWVLAAGQVLALPQPILSPLQGTACVWWHVRAVRIRERNASAQASGLQVHVDVAVSADTPFVVRTDLGDVTVHAAVGRMGSGLQVIHRDQGSVTRSLVVAGQTYELPPVAHGTRQVQEGTLVPGQAVWVEGRLTASASGPLVTGGTGRPAVVDTTPLANRRRTATAIVALCTVVGMVLLGGAVLALLR